MKNITFSADEKLIEQARGLAQLRGTTLNEEFRVWMGTYVASHDDKVLKAQTRRLIDQLTSPSIGKSNVPFAHIYSPTSQQTTSRAQFNEREERMLNRLDGSPFHRNIDK
jgi:hypothetical protein